MKKNNRFIYCFLMTILMVWLFCICGGNKSHAQFFTDATDKDKLVINILSLKSGEGGDCSILRYNDVEILIDSGESSHFEKVKEYIDHEMESDQGKVWDYIIYTHPDKDHIGSATQVLNYINDNWKIGTIIDYDIEALEDDFYTTKTAREYRNVRNEIYKKTETEYFSAATLSQDNLIREFIEDNLSIKVLFNLYDTYDKLTNHGKNLQMPTNFSNDMSVCCLICLKNQKVLFTGDLCEAGEKELIHNYSDLIDQVTLYKAAHHGSDTSNCENFVDIIKPLYVPVTLNKNSTGLGKTFNSFFKYTDYIFPTAVEYYYNYPDIYGDLCFKLDGDNVEVFSSCNCDSFGKSKQIWETYIDEYDVNWFDEMVASTGSDISDFVTIYTFDEDKPTYCNCSLIKYGHYDILVDCGSSDTTSDVFTEKLRKYVIDDELEYVIVSHYHVENISQLIASSLVKENDGLFNSMKIGTVIDSKNTTFQNENINQFCVFYNQYLLDISKARQRISLDYNEEKTFTIGKFLKFTVMGNYNDPTESVDENSFSLVTVGEFHGKKMVFVGDLTDYSGLVSYKRPLISDVEFLKHSNAPLSIYYMNKYYEFIKTANPKHIVVGTPSGLIYHARELYSERKLNEIAILCRAPYACEIHEIGYVDQKGNYSANDHYKGCIEYCVECRNMNEIVDFFR